MKVKSLFQLLLPHLIAFAACLILLFIYFSPVLSGKSLVQSDVLQVNGSLKEAETFMVNNHEEILWSNSTFSGMPVWRGYGKNLLVYFNRFAQAALPLPVLLCFLCFAGFYIILKVFKVNNWLAFLGGVAYMLSSSNLLSMEAGHVNKVFDMALMAPVLAGVLLCLRGRYLIGAAVTLIFTGLQIYYSHIQINYYLFIMILLLMVAEFIRAFRAKELKTFLTASAVLAVSAGISILPNVSRLWTTSEFGKATVRGGSELSAKKESAGTGLDKEYALGWSNGLAEPMTFFIPYFYGGGSHEELGKSSDTYKALKANNVPAQQINNFVKGIPLYWGTQPFTSGPVYFGAIVCFLYVLGLFWVKGSIKWWVISVSVLSVLLSYGKNLEWFTDIFFYYVPLYNKFRSVTMILSTTQIVFPLLGIMALKKLVDGELDKAEFWRGLKWATIISGGIAIFFAALGGLFFDFSVETDKQRGLPEWLVESIVNDRDRLFRLDALRSLFFVLVAATGIWAFYNEKIKPMAFYIGLSAFVLIDLWSVDKRYVNNDDFKLKKKINQEIFAKSPADELILQDKDLYYKVLNVTGNPFTDAITSYHHKSLGGYSAIKLSRYNDLIEQQISKNNMRVLNMLNTKYIIFPDSTGYPLVQRNTNALGNAWFVKGYRLVSNPDEEMKALTYFNPKDTAIVDKIFEMELKGLNLQEDTTGSIVLTKYHPDHLNYISETPTERLAVFSDIYYQPGWNAYVDGKLTHHIRVDYVLRAMRIPAGKHEIIFKFEPTSYYLGEKISFAGSIILFVLVIGLLGLEIRNVLKKETPVETARGGKKII